MNLFSGVSVFLALYLSLSSNSIARIFIYGIGAITMLIVVAAANLILNAIDRQERKSTESKQNPHPTPYRASKS